LLIGNKSLVNGANLMLTQFMECQGI